MKIPHKYKSPLILTLVLGLSIGTVGCNEKGGESAKTKGDQSKVVAIVNGATITQNDLDDYRSAHPNPSAQNDKALLEDLVMQKVVYQEALKDKMDQDPKIAREIERSRTNILLSAFVRKTMGNIKVTDEELHAEYDKLKDRMSPPEYKARHILVKDEEQAKKIIAELDKGADFAALAKKYSNDSSAKDGGDLGWFNPRQMVPQFSMAVAKLQKGEYTKEPVQSQFGWHIIKLEDMRQSEPPAFDTMKDRLETMLKQSKTRDYFQTLKGKAKITIEGEKNEAAVAKESEAKDEKTQPKAQAEPATEK